MKLLQKKSFQRENFREQQHVCRSICQLNFRFRSINCNIYVLTLTTVRNIHTVSAGSLSYLLGGLKLHFELNKIDFGLLDMNCTGDKRPEEEFKFLPCDFFFPSPHFIERSNMASLEVNSTLGAGE